MSDFKEFSRTSLDGIKPEKVVPVRQMKYDAYYLVDGYYNNYYRDGCSPFAEELSKENKKLKEDNLKLRTKVEQNISADRISVKGEFSLSDKLDAIGDILKQNIPVERIEGLDAYIFGKEIGKGVQRLGQIREDGLGFEKNVSIEDHEALKKEVESNGNYITDLQTKVHTLNGKVAELEKRPDIEIIQHQKSFPGEEASYYVTPKHK